MKKIKLWNDLKVNLIASALLLFLIEPVIKWGWNTMTFLTWSLFEYLQDSAIRSAALGQRDWVIVMLMTIAIFLPFALLPALFTGHKAATYVVAGIGRITQNQTYRTLLTRALGVLLLIVSYLMVGLQFVFIPFVDLQLVTSFQQRMAVLAPHITDQEEEEMRAEWAMMRKRQDFNVLNSKMDAKAQASGVKLPELLYK